MLRLDAGRNEIDDELGFVFNDSAAIGGGGVFDEARLYSLITFSTIPSKPWRAVFSFSLIK
jgi:hypothetical protein